MRGDRRFAFALACCTAAIAAPAGAQNAPPAGPSAPSAPAPSPALAEARALFEQGVRFTNEQRWGEALEQFRRARALVERPSIVFNIGSALVRLGRLREAVPELERFLAISTSEQEQADRALATQMIAEARASLARLALTVNVETALVEIDGIAEPGAGTSRALTLDAGPHRVRVSATDYDEERFELALTPGQSLSRAVTLREQPTQLRIELTPATAAFTIDGAPVTEATVTVTPGEHRVEARAPGFQPLTRRVLARRAQRVVVGLALAPVPRGGVLQSPWFWTAVGVVVAGAAVGVGAGLAVANPTEEAPFGGTTSQVLQGIQWRGAVRGGQ